MSLPSDCTENGHRQISCALREIVQQSSRLKILRIATDCMEGGINIGTILGSQPPPNLQKLDLRGVQAGEPEILVQIFRQLHGTLVKILLVGFSFDDPTTKGTLEGWEQALTELKEWNWNALRIFCVGHLPTYGNYIELDFEPLLTRKSEDDVLRPLREEAELEATESDDSE